MKSYPRDGDWAPDTRLREVYDLYDNWQVDLAAVLRYMQQNSPNVSLVWKADKNCWECAWQIGRLRYAGESPYFPLAVREALKLALDSGVDFAPAFALMVNA